MQQQLEELVATLDAQNLTKADYVLPTSKLRMTEAGILVAEGTKRIQYEPNEVWHDGAAFMLNIPGGYYKRMQKDCPELMAASVNKWLDLRKTGAGVMMRTFESEDRAIARAMLSDRYNILDNYDVLFAALDAIRATGLNIQITEATVTDKRLYLCVTAPEIEVDAREVLKNYLKEKDAEVGNGIISGFIISNSEVGQGSFEIRPRAVVLKCKNGMISTDDRFRRVHLGGQLGEGQILWSEQTKQKNFELVISQTKDAINTFLSKDYLTGMIEKLHLASTQTLERPVDTVQNVCKELMVTEERRNSILKHFMSGGDHNASGVLHALTMEAQSMDADDRFEMEAKAFNIITKITSFDKPFSKN